MLICLLPNLYQYALHFATGTVIEGSKAPRVVSLLLHPIMGTASSPSHKAACTHLCVLPLCLAVLQLQWLNGGETKCVKMPESNDIA